MRPCAMRVTYAWMFEGKTMYREGYECVKYRKECKDTRVCKYKFAEISPANMERREDK